MDANAALAALGRVTGTMAEAVGCRADGHGARLPGLGRHDARRPPRPRAPVGGHRRPHRPRAGSLPGPGPVRSPGTVVCRVRSRAEPDPGRPRSRPPGVDVLPARPAGRASAPATSARDRRPPRRPAPGRGALPTRGLAAALPHLSALEAEDGVDEVLRVMAPRKIERLAAVPPAELVPARRPIAFLDQRHRQVRDPPAGRWRGAGRCRLTPDVVGTVSGPAAHLYLALWGRADRASLHVDGERSAVERLLDASLVP